MKKTYEVTKTKNGFIIQFNHEDDYYNNENKAVALTLKQVVKIIDEDIKMKETDTTP